MFVQVEEKNEKELWVPFCGADDDDDDDDVGDNDGKAILDGLYVKEVLTWCERHKDLLNKNPPIRRFSLSKLKKN